jgi:hypothetical protein
MKWPEGKSFAFSVFDDTDGAHITNVGEVYRLLGDLGFKTTKSIWMSREKQPVKTAGSTCEDPEYLVWVSSLAQKGFEIGYHLNAADTSTREETKRGLDRFRELFGYDPCSMANHSTCKENLYWGAERLSGVRKTIYNLSTRYKNRARYRGQIEGDPHFWGDLCRERIKYCRGFVYPEINTLKVCPFMPYHDPQRPYVNYWYAAAEGSQVDSYVKLLSESNQEQLESEGGACIVYTHFASGFQDTGRLNDRFKTLMERMARRNGWYVPVSTLLDYLLKQNGHHDISPVERRRLEWRWLRRKLRAGTS